MKLTYRATFIVYEICIATLIFHATKKRIPVNTFYFLYPNVKFVFAKQCSFSLLRFFICIDVKPTISLTLIYCYELVIIPVGSRNGFEHKLHRQHCLFYNRTKIN